MHELLRSNVKDNLCILYILLLFSIAELIKKINNVFGSKKFYRRIRFVAKLNFSENIYILKVKIATYFESCIFYVV